MVVTFKHCDDYTEPQCLVDFINHARAPAHGALLPDPTPLLFATYANQTVRVTMASRFGDVGISRNLQGTSPSYFRRLPIDELTNLRTRP